MIVHSILANGQSLQHAAHAGVSLLTIGASVLGGALAGGISGGLARHRRDGAQRRIKPTQIVDPAENRLIDYMAQRWANAHGYRGHESRLADKMRILRRIEKALGEQEWEL